MASLYTVKQARVYDRKFKLSALAQFPLTSLKTPQGSQNQHFTMRPRELLNLTTIKTHIITCIKPHLAWHARQASCPQRNAYL